MIKCLQWLITYPFLVLCEDESTGEKKVEIASLPKDLLYYIFSFLIHRPNDLQSLTLTCKRFKILLKDPLFYREFVSQPNLSKLNLTAEHLHLLIKKSSPILRLDLSGYWTIENVLFKKFMELCPDLEKLDLRSKLSHQTPKLMQKYGTLLTLLKTCTKLKELKLDGLSFSDPSEPLSIKDIQSFLKLFKDRGGVINLQDLSATLKHPTAKSVTALSNTILGKGGYNLFICALLAKAQSTDMPKLRTVDLKTSSWLHSKDIKILHGSLILSQIHHLSLNIMREAYDACVELIKTKNLKQLRSFKLTGVTNAILSCSMLSILLARGFKLKKLALGSNFYFPKELPEAMWPQSLRKLTLHDRSDLLDEQIWKSWSNSGSLTQLVSFKLYQSTLNRNSVEYISRCFPNLRQFKLLNTKIDPSCINKLIDSKIFPHLEYLDVFLDSSELTKVSMTNRVKIQQSIALLKQYRPALKVNIFMMENVLYQVL